MLAERERSPCTTLDMQFLRWAAGEWLERPVRSSSYCKLNPEAKSTIALAFSTDGVLFASERRHNVTTCTGGVRRAFVLELWEGAENRHNRHR